MAGQLIYLVGPSGSGKDSILRELAPRLDDKYIILKRVITRPPWQQRILNPYVQLIF